LSFADLWQYDAFVDLRESEADAPEELEQRTFYGRLQHVISFTVPPSPALHLDTEESVVFVDVKTVDLIPDTAHLPVAVDYFRRYKGEGDMLDLGTVQCLIGLVLTRNAYAIIDRTGTLDRAWYNDDGPAA
jgi:hypothetical protein